MKDKKIFTIPNVLSMFRIVLIPFILWMFFTERYYVSGGLLILSGITDVVDGFIARKFNQVSSLGKVLDPIADKLTILSVVISLSVYSTVVLVLTVIYVVKELIFVMGGLFVIKLTGKTHSSKWYGKVTTVFLYLTMFVHIFWPDIPFVASLVLIIISCILVCASLGLYMAYSVKLLREAGVKLYKIGEKENGQPSNGQAAGECAPADGSEDAGLQTEAEETTAEAESNETAGQNSLKSDENASLSDDGASEADGEL